MKRTWAAPWAPTDAKGRLMKEEIQKNLNFLIEKRVEGVFVGGSTGEFTYMDVATRNELLKFVVEHSGPLQIIANISHLRLSAVLELAHFAKQFKLTALSLLPPIYYPFTQEDIGEYFIHVGKAVQYPLCVYNFPELVGNRIQIETIDRIASEIPIAAFKHSGQDFAFLIPLMASAKKNNFKILTGNDILLPEALTLGVYGCISGLINAIPELILQAFKPDYRESVAIKLKELGAILAALPFPLNYAAAFEARGFAVGTPKMPISAPSHAKYRKMVGEIKALRLFS